jgi:glycosyltransferase involved in cell wall biosynthesis
METDAIKISVITPSVRPEGLNIIEKCLKRQTFKDFEWIVVSPKELHKKINVKPDLLLADPPKNEGDFWTLCKAWNLAYNKARGKLIVNIQDMIWFKPDLLERFWNHYEKSRDILVTAVGDHYSDTDERGEPINLVWQDPRKRIDQGTFYEIYFPDMEMSVCSIPKKALIDCGGIDEEYDKANGIQEKEMCMRLSHLNYKFYIDQSIEYKAIHHGRLTDNWDDHYWKVTTEMFKKHAKLFMQDKKPLNVGYVK